MYDDAPWLIVQVRVRGRVSTAKLVVMVLHLQVVTLARVELGIQVSNCEVNIDDCKEL